jgi:hypothetical protein
MTNATRRLATSAIPTITRITLVALEELVPSFRYTVPTCSFPSRIRPKTARAGCVLDPVPVGRISVGKPGSTSSRLYVAKQVPVAL